jgi:hypothetical protein
VSVLTAAGVSAGVRVLAHKKRTGAHRHPWDVGISAALVVSSIAFAAWGFASGRTLFMVFPIIGLVTGGNQLAYWLRPPSHPMHWWFEHMGAMLGSCIAATTAFLVVNAERLGLQTFGLVVWIAPAIVGAPGIAIWSTYYRRRFSQSIQSTRKVATPIMAGAVPKSS